MAFIMSFYDDYGDYDELRKIFLQLDKSKDGKLTIEEINDGLTLVLGKVKRNSREYLKIMEDLDKDCNGVIDYSEFLTAAIDK